MSTVDLSGHLIGWTSSKKEFVDPICGMIGNAIDDVGEVGVRVGRVRRGWRRIAATCQITRLDRPCGLLGGSVGEGSPPRRGDRPRLSPGRRREIAARRAESQPLNAIFDMVSGEHAASLAPLLTANGHLVCIQDRQEKTPLPPFTTTISLHEVGLNAITPRPTIRNGAGWWAPRGNGEGYRIGPVRSSDYRRREFRAASCGSCSVGAWSKSWQSCRGSIGGGILGRGVVIASQSFSLRLFHRINLW